MKKTLKVIGIVGIIITAVMIIARMTLNGNGTTAPSSGPIQPITTQQQPENPAASSSGTGTTAGESAPQKYGVKDAVQAAAQANSKLSEAVLLPELQMRQIVDSTVIPAKRRVVTQNYLAAAPALVRGLNYQSRIEAQSTANYYVVTQKYWVQSFGRGHAVIWLYNITHAITPPDQKTVQSYAITHPGQTPPGQEYYVPSITIVQMRWLNGHWLWAGTQDPPSDKAPPQEGHPTFQDAVKAYLSYTRSFKNYANLH